MKRSIITFTIAVMLLFIYGCTNHQTSSASNRQVVLIEDDEDQELQTAQTVAETPTPIPTPEPTPEPKITPEVMQEPDAIHTASLVARVIPEPEPEEEIIDSCFDENVQYGEYHEDVPVSGNTDGWFYYGSCRITHYCNCSVCCGQWAGGNTASGAYPTTGRTVACGGDIPFGAEVMVGDQVYVCEDRGVGSGCVDIYCDSHDEALARGMYYTDVYVRY